VGDLSRNFSRSEFECKCGCGEAEVSPFLIEVLQRLRDILGVPITVTSGRRCAKHNAAVGGAKNSQHLLGLAADIRAEGWTAKDLLRVLRVLVRANALYVGYAYKISKNAVHIDVRQPESLTVVSWRR
jgi:uncharacterized protein YcbK (DUF882 family)